MTLANKNKLRMGCQSAIIFCGMVLLAIWCIRNSIALRNILLILGSILAILILLNRPPCANKCKAPLHELHPYIPIILSILLFFWVILHLIFFSTEATLQLQEFKGTWFRAALALLTGSVIGLVLRMNKQMINLLWLGIYCSFCYLLTHYLFAAIDSNTLFIPDYYFSSPFGNKINTVLMGCLFIAAACGGAAYSLFQTKSAPWFLYFFWLSGVALILFSYTTIIDTRNGIGVALILIVLWVIYISIKMLREKQAIKTSLAIIFSIGLALIFTQQHLSINKGWAHFFQDIEIGVQIDKFSNWQDISKFGYPKTTAGDQVYPNNYERAAWASAGIRAIQTNPMGFGLLEHSLGYSIKKEYPQATVLSSHSGWIDLGLAFGIPGLVLSLGALLSLLTLALKSRSPHSLTAAWLTASLLLTFTVAETSSKHSIEILFFIIGLLTLLITNNRKQDLTAI